MLLKVMRELTNTWITMQVATHELRFARDVADRVVFLEHDDVEVTDCPTAKFFSDTSGECIQQFLRRY